jgi:hypothetical protein
MIRSFSNMALPARGFSIKILLFGLMELDHPQKVEFYVGHTHNLVNSLPTANIIPPCLWNRLISLYRGFLFSRSSLAILLSSLKRRRRRQKMTLTESDVISTEKKVWKEVVRNIKNDSKLNFKIRWRGEI